MGFAKLLSVTGQLNPGGHDPAKAEVTIPSSGSAHRPKHQKPLLKPLELAKATNRNDWTADR